MNRFPEQLFKKGDKEAIEQLLLNYPVEYYAIRDKSKAGGTFKLKVAFKDVLTEIRGYDLFTINVSSANYEENQMLVGEVAILSNGDVYLTLSVDSKASVRDALRNPTFNFNTDIFDKKLNDIPYFDLIYQYIINHNLQNVIVEFALFNKDVGIKQERIIIYELRTHY